MIYVVCTVSSAAAVKAPPIIDRADAQPPPAGPAIGLSVGDLLPRVLSYFPAAFKVSNRKTALAFNCRLPDCQTLSER